MHRTGSDVQRSSLEVFILALISQGLTTTYVLQSEAGLSLGATVPALNRMAKTKLVSMKIEGRRHEFALTKAGEKALRDWRPPSGRASTDFDDVLRTVFLTISLNRNVGAATELLAQAARARSRAAKDCADELRGRRLDVKNLDAAAYRWMRLTSEQHRLAAESKALQVIFDAVLAIEKSPTRAARKRK
jgi:DNA-binding PadR family transcriptional regulator